MRARTGACARPPAAASTSNGGAGERLRSFFSDVRDVVERATQPLDVRRGVGLGREQHALLVGRRGDLALGHLGEPGGERLVGVVGGEPHVDAPVLDGNERSDLALALDDQPHRDGLHTAGRETGADLLPEQRRDAIADEAIEDAASLLRVVELEVDRARLAERFQDRIPRDLRERDALRGRGVDPSRVATYAIASPSRS